MAGRGRFRGHFGHRHDRPVRGLPWPCPPAHRPVRTARGSEPGPGPPHCRIRRGTGASNARRGTSDTRSADPHRGSRGRLGAERAACLACPHPRKQHLPPAPPGPWPAARAPGRQGLQPGEGTSPGRTRCPSRWRPDLLACQTGKAPGNRGLDGGSLPRVHWLEPDRRASSRADEPGRTESGRRSPSGTVVSWMAVCAR